jgi:hypothetical protein
MAERRMFTKKIIDSDAFTELPPSTQALYFHLCMNADDDGFNNKIRQAMFNAHADRNDFNLLVSNRFIIPFNDRGVIVIKHWKLHNYIQNDRYHKTEYVEEKAKLILKTNGVYTEKDEDVYNMDTECIQDGYNMDTEVRLGKVSIGKSSIGKGSIGEMQEGAEPPKRKRFTPPTLEEVAAYCKERNNNIDPQHFIDYYTSNGWQVGKNKMKDWKAAVRTWERNGFSKPQKTDAAQELNSFYDMAAEWAEGNS